MNFKKAIYGLFVILLPLGVFAGTSQQTTDTVLMVAPQDFAFNLETAKSNAFQKRAKIANPEKRAMREFKIMVHTLRTSGINVITMPSRHDIKTPDAVFPNNWFSTHRIGNNETLIIYPMLTPNRQAEVRVNELLKRLHHHKYYPTKIIDLRKDVPYAPLEGTGSMVLDRVNHIIYAALSPRTSQKTLEHAAKILGYKVIAFKSYDAKNKRIYHTNVMMSVGSKYAVVCLPCIRPKTKRHEVRESLIKSGKSIISVNQSQIANMTGNILELKTRHGNPVIVLSNTAYHHFTKSQRKRLAQFAKLIPVDIKTIEMIGGGSARCMLGEIF
jgi:hypothetical protein